MPRKRKRPTHSIAIPMPSPGQQRRFAAEHLARTLVETAPGRKQQLDEITRAVMAAGERAEKTARGAKRRA